ncbi:hypothetical protein [Rhodoplanes elegans]|uniref:hypothetical protein n=1 Tax=Rhodoplanes elegans TaxID=29408 RepID=UPI00147553A4|nr:hypothetical protein [Rhodoplanes elegans]
MSPAKDRSRTFKVRLFSFVIRMLLGPYVPRTSINFLYMQSSKLIQFETNDLPSQHG